MTAAWVLNIVGLGVLAIPGLGLLVWFLFVAPLWIASFVMACIATARGRALAGGLTIAFNLVLFPLIATLMMGVGIATGIAALLGQIGK